VQLCLLQALPVSAARVLHGCADAAQLNDQLQAALAHAGEDAVAALGLSPAATAAAAGAARESGNVPLAAVSGGVPRSSSWLSRAPTLLLLLLAGLCLMSCALVAVQLLPPAMLPPGMVCTPDNAQACRAVLAAQMAAAQQEPSKWRIALYRAKWYAQDAFTILWTRRLPEGVTLERVTQAWTDTISTEQVAGMSHQQAIDLFGSVPERALRPDIRDKLGAALAHQAKAEAAAAEKEAARKAAAERAAAEWAAAEEARLAAQRAEAERIAREEAEAERIAAEKAEAERIAAEKAAEEARLAAERAEAERIAREKAEAERVAAEKAAAEARLAAEKAEAERIAREKAEAERLAAELAEAERIAAEQARLAAERAEAERLAAERAEAERIAAERAEAERIAAEKAAEEARLAAEAAEAEQLAAERALAAQREEAERRAYEQAEQEAAAALLAAEQEAAAALLAAEQAVLLGDEEATAAAEPDAASLWPMYWVSPRHVWAAWHECMSPSSHHVHDRLWFCMLAAKQRCYLLRCVARHRYEIMTNVLDVMVWVGS